MPLSRIGKQVIQCNSDVKVTLDESSHVITVAGPKGSLTIQTQAGFALKLEDNTVQLILVHEDKRNRLKKFHGLYAALLKNAVTGVTTGFTKTLKLVGVGYKAAMKGDVLDIALGYSHPVLFTPPEGIEIKAPDLTTIIVEGIDKQLVGICAAKIRDFRKPEPYKGKGIRYENEFILRKAGKTGK